MTYHHTMDGFNGHLMDSSKLSSSVRLRDFDGLNEDLLLEAFVDSLGAIENTVNYKVDHKLAFMGNPHMRMQHSYSGTDIFGSAMDVNIPDVQQRFGLASHDGSFYGHHHFGVVEESFPEGNQIESSSKKRKAEEKEAKLLTDGKIPKGQSMAAKERRRERNKVLARKTRVKKKVELECLRDQVLKLRTENEKLKSVVQSRLPRPLCAKLLIECDIQLPDNVAALVQSMVARTETSQTELEGKLLQIQRSFCICNCSAQDVPIVYASPGFMELTRYPIEEILGRNCRFLQGPETDKAEVNRMSQSIQAGVEVMATIRNYRRDGTAFWNFIQIAPLKDIEGNVALIVGVQCEVSSQTMGARYSDEAGRVALPMPQEDIYSSLSIKRSISNHHVYRDPKGEVVDPIGTMPSSNLGHLSGADLDIAMSGNGIDMYMGDMMGIGIEMDMKVSGGSQRRQDFGMRADELADQFMGHTAHQAQLEGLDYDLFNTRSGDGEMSGFDGEEQFLTLTHSSVTANASMMSAVAASSGQGHGSADYHNGSSQPGFSHNGFSVDGQTTSASGSGESTAGDSNSNDPRSEGSQYGGSRDGEVSGDNEGSRDGECDSEDIIPG